MSAMRRAADHSAWVKSSEFLERYKVIVYVIVTFLLALGFDFKLPGQTMKDLQVQIDTLRTNWQAIQDKENIQLKLSCVNPAFSEHDRQLAGLDCNKTLGGR